MPVAASVQTVADLFALFKEEKVLERFGLEAIGVFGSLARGEAFNDIDLLVEGQINYKELISLKKYLEEKTGYKVDLVHHDFAEPLILYRALKDLRRYAASS